MRTFCCCCTLTRVMRRSRLRSCLPFRDMAARAAALVLNSAKAKPLPMEVAGSRTTRTASSADTPSAGASSGLPSSASGPVKNWMSSSSVVWKCRFPMKSERWGSNSPLPAAPGALASPVAPRFLLGAAAMFTRRWWPPSSVMLAARALAASAWVVSTTYAVAGARSSTLPVMMAALRGIFDSMSSGTLRRRTLSTLPYREKCVLISLRVALAGTLPTNTVRASCSACSSSVFLGLLVLGSASACPCSSSPSSVPACSSAPSPPSSEAGSEAGPSPSSSASSSSSSSSWSDPPSSEPPPMPISSASSSLLKSLSSSLMISGISSSSLPSPSLLLSFLGLGCLPFLPCTCCCFCCFWGGACFPGLPAAACWALAGAACLPCAPCASCPCKPLPPLPFSDAGFLPSFAFDGFSTCCCCC
mmetsp:Transcript_2196/g.5588  ORF Transcript_2196/g.5588 Transcript_2196/m.5588 type:complete len:417 (-) Transcript_2196:309-1559(-)